MDTNPDPLAVYGRAFQAGRTAAAPTPPPATQGPSPSPHATVDALLGGLDDHGRLAAARAQEQLAAILQGLKLQSPDPRERLAMARHLAALHPEFGVDPRAIGLGDVTDAGISEHLATAMALKTAIEHSGGADDGFRLLGVE